MTTPSSWWPAYVGIGSNLENPLSQVELAIVWLAELPESRLIRCSPSYSSAPMGLQDQPDFVNAVAALLTRLNPHKLLLQLQELEARAGRKRGGGRWSARTLDLDLLAYAGMRVATDTLSLPHPGIAERPFVSLPLADVAPGFEIPGHGLASVLASRHALSGVCRIE